MLSNNVEINVIGGVIDEAEKQEYIKHILSKAKGEVLRIDIKLDGDFVDLNWYTAPVPFDRVRRITGYLVGTLDRFNDGKRAEEHDRVKHNVDD